LHLIIGFYNIAEYLFTTFNAYKIAFDKLIIENKKLNFFYKT